MGTLLLILACGRVSTAGADAGADGGGGGAGGMSTDAAPETTPTDTGSSEAGRDTPGSDAADGPSCGAWQNGTPPYCSSCVCANGNRGQGCCQCGALPCCDPSCQS